MYIVVCSADCAAAQVNDLKHMLIFYVVNFPTLVLQKLTKQEKHYLVVDHGQCIFILWYHVQLTLMIDEPTPEPHLILGLHI